MLIYLIDEQDYNSMQYFEENQESRWWVKIESSNALGSQLEF